MNVEEVMSRPVRTCGPNDTLQTAAQLMWDHEVGSVVVLLEGTIVGMLTDRDVCMGAYTSGQALWEVPVQRAMTPAPVTIRENATVAAASAGRRPNRTPAASTADRYNTPRSTRSNVRSRNRAKAVATPMKPAPTA